MTSNALIKRLEALEKAIVCQPPELIFVWTKSLADRIEPLLPKNRNYRLVRYAERPDEDEAFEAKLREQNPREAERLDLLLQGKIPTEH